MHSPSSAEHASTTPTDAMYLYGGKAEPVRLLAWTRDGQPVIAWPDGAVAVVERDRIRVARRELA